MTSCALNSPLSIWHEPSSTFKYAMADPPSSVLMVMYIFIGYVYMYYEDSGPDPPSSVLMALYIKINGPRYTYT